jgi:undecaprenyl-diphosphatase
MLNGSYSLVSDFIFWWISDKFIWIPLYLWVIWLIFKKHGKTAIPIVLVLALDIVLSDQISGLIKDSIQRFRPTHNLEISSLVHTINDYKGGMYGFVSSHAANAFAFAIFTIGILKNLRYTSLILICGAGLGVLISLFSLFLLRKFGNIRT